MHVMGAAGALAVTSVGGKVMHPCSVFTAWVNTGILGDP
jgi:hypothetical protein